MEPKYKIEEFRYNLHTKDLKLRYSHQFNSFIDLYNKYYQLHIDDGDQWRQVKIFMLREIDDKNAYVEYKSLKEIKAILLEKFRAENFELWIKFITTN